MLADLTLQNWEKLIIILPYEPLKGSFGNYPITILKSGMNLRSPGTWLGYAQKIVLKLNEIVHKIILPSRFLMMEKK